MPVHLKKVVQLETEIYISIADHEGAYTALLAYSVTLPDPTNLTDLLTSFGYAASHTRDGSIRWVKKTAPKIDKTLEKQIWEILAPFIADGSYITFGEEDGEVWAWVFANKKLHEIDFSFYRQAVVKGIVIQEAISIT